MGGAYRTQDRRERCIYTFCWITSKKEAIWENWAYTGGDSYDGIWWENVSTEFNWLRIEFKYWHL
jgi:hypothetical protein